MRLTIIFNDIDLTTESIRVIDSNDITFRLIQYNSKTVDIIDVVTNINNDFKNMLSIRFDDKEILFNIQEYFHDIVDVKSVIEKIKSKLSSSDIGNIRIIVAKNMRGKYTIAFID